jgi:hypothetical protein
MDKGKGVRIPAWAIAKIAAGQAQGCGARSIRRHRCATESGGRARDRGRGPAPGGATGAERSLINQFSELISSTDQDLFDELEKQIVELKGPKPSRRRRGRGV